MKKNLVAEQELSNPCIACGGAAHPASGMELPSGKLICGPCVRDFHDWITNHSKKRYRVGPKGSKTSKYIPFPTGIVKEHMRLSALLEYLKEDDSLNKFMDLSDGIKWRATQAAATPGDTSLNRREGWLKSIKPIALELVGLIDQIAEGSLDEQDTDPSSEPKPDQVVIEDSSLSEKAPPGMEDTVMKLKKQYPDDPEKPYAVAWSIYNRKTGK